MNRKRLQTTTAPHGEPGIETYFSQVGCPPQLTREEQLNLGHRLKRARERYQLLLLAIPFVFRAALAVLRRVVLGTLKPKWVLFATAGEPVATTLARARHHVQALDRLLAESRVSLRAALRREASVSDRRKAARRLTKLTRKAARLVKACMLRPRPLDRIFTSVRELMARMSGLRKAKEGSPSPEATRPSRREVVRLMLKAGMPCRRLVRQLDRAEALKKEADSLREEFVRPFLPMVVWFAKKQQNLGVPLEDLIQEGNIGLLWAADTYEPARGRKLSTYAMWWIRCHIRKAIEARGTIQVPKYTIWALQKLRRKRTELRNVLGRDPTTAELASALPMSEKKVKCILSSELRQLPADVPFMREGMGGAPLPLMEILTAPADEDRFMQAECAACLEQAMRRLSAREQRVLSLRFGLGGNETHTLKEVGEKFGLTRERIRQIERDALAALRAELEPVIG